MANDELSTILDIILYQYAKTICRNTLGQRFREDSEFLKKTYSQLRSDKKIWTHIQLVNRDLVQTDTACAFCGSNEDTVERPIVPLDVAVHNDCPSCRNITGPRNRVWMCPRCASLYGSGHEGLYHIVDRLCKEYLEGSQDCMDSLPILVERKYLLTIYRCHVCRRTLDLSYDRPMVPLDIDLPASAFTSTL